MVTKAKDFQQKRRNRAIAIEETAINKVRCTRIPGFLHCQNKTIQLLHKKLLREAKTLNEYRSEQFKRAVLGCNDKEKELLKKYLRAYNNADIITKEKCYSMFMNNKQISEKLKCIIGNYADNDMEVGILLDLHEMKYIDNNNIDDFEGRCYWVIRGGVRCVEMKSNPEARVRLSASSKNRLLFMHNHPSTGTFSAEDFKMFCNNKTLYAMTIIGNDGGNYILNKQAGFDDSVALLEYGNLIMNKYKDKTNNATLAMRDILNNANKLKLNYIKGGKRDD